MKQFERIVYKGWFIEKVGKNTFESYQFIMTYCERFVSFSLKEAKETIDKQKDFIQWGNMGRRG
jgi:hypothetical protein